MALTFTTGTLQLANWGFSTGDIAVIAGAGRKVGTWVMANLKDRTLFEWMNVDVDAVCSRKGLIDTQDLQKRWDQKVQLLQNGRVRSFTTDSARSGAPVLQGMDRFTWMMTLFTAGLDATMSATDMRKVMEKLLLKIFEENEAGLEYVRQSAPEQFDGWLSAATVRGILLQTRIIWDQLGKQGKHQPGFIPGTEINDVFRFLSWLVNGPNEEKQYRTASTDIFSLAALLERIGVNITTTEDQNHQFDESNLVVLWDSSWPYPASVANLKQQPRYGMRIPLDHMEEVASLFTSDRNRLRSIFEEGMKAVSRDNVRLSAGFSEDNPPYVQGSPFQEDQQDLIYTLEFSTTKSVPRLESDVYRLADWLLLQPTPAISEALLRLFRDLGASPDETHNLQMIALTLDNQLQESRFHDIRSHFNYGEALASVQALFLGYWYKLLHPLLETSQLTIREGFGSWTWSDIHCLNFLRQCIRTRVHRRTKNRKIYSMYRHEILKLVGYLFGGAELAQVQSTKLGAIGVLGKQPTVYSSLIRGCVENFGKFTLLDLDPTCVPSSSSGIIFPGQTRAVRRSQPKSVNQSEIQAFNMNVLPLVSNEDFTVHIEPDWDYDANTCLVAYRYKGRIIHRLNPRQVDLALARQQLVAAVAGAGWFQGAAKDDTDTPRSDSPAGEDPPYHAPSGYCLIPFDEFHGSVVVDPEERLADMADNAVDPPGYVFTPLMINVSGSSNALLCMTCMYEGWTGSSKVRVIRTKSDFEDAIENFAKVLIVFRG